jgi:hypothetical protein
VKFVPVCFKVRTSLNLHVLVRSSVYRSVVFAQYTTLPI